MPGDANYALEKLSMAIYTLAVDLGDVRKRLKKAYMQFLPVSKEDLPLHLREDWEWIHNQLTRYGPICHPDGTIFIMAVDNTLSRIKNSTGEKIAKKIVVLTYELESYLQDKKKS